MKTSIKQLRQIIREEVIRDQRAIMQQDILREALLDSIKSMFNSNKGSDGGKGEEKKVNLADAFMSVSKLFSGLTERISSDVNKIQTALPASEGGAGPLEIAHAILNGFISGGLGSLSQMNKDLGTISSAFSIAAKSVDSDPDGTKKRLWATINSSLGKATSRSE